MQEPYRENYNISLYGEIHHDYWLETFIRMSFLPQTDIYIQRRPNQILIEFSDFSFAFW